MNGFFTVRVFGFDRKFVFVSCNRIFVGSGFRDRFVKIDWG